MSTLSGNAVSSIAYIVALHVIQIGITRVRAYLSTMLSALRSGGSSTEQPMLAVRRRGDTPSVDIDSFGFEYRDSLLRTHDNHSNGLKFGQNLTIILNIRTNHTD